MARASFCRNQMVRRWLPGGGGVGRIAYSAQFAQVWVCFSERLGASDFRLHGSWIRGRVSGMESDCLYCLGCLSLALFCVFVVPGVGWRPGAARRDERPGRWGQTIDLGFGRDLDAGYWILDTGLGAVSLHWGGIVPHGVGDCQLKSGCGKPRQMRGPILARTCANRDGVLSARIQAVALASSGWIQATDFTDYADC